MVSKQLSLLYATDHMLLSEAREKLQEQLDEGVVCPCCDQLARRYKVPLMSSMAAVLCLLSRLPEARDWIHVENYLRSAQLPPPLRGHFHKLRYWGLLEQKPELREDDSPRNGFWRITAKGLEFASGSRMCMSHVLLYNGEQHGFTGSLITIHGALRKRFDYAALMSGSL